MDEIDRAQEREQIDRDLAIAMARRRAAQLRGQRRADQGCTHCGEMIEVARLKVLPETDCCANCAHAIEAGGKRWI